ncbi:prophage LambdaSa2, PblB [Streptococcus varani]|uniref:Prophage LambdaSa2, PblB n=1 Tax=Streptococcus varani TaxID=1608583 RepID=A0A0E4CTM3_9STRE|nr:prophage LambdaSa2, PblB [Streptococcus varani]
MISIKDNNIPLVAAFDDEISQEANSDYKLSFKYPAKHEYRSLIKKGLILEADDLHGTQLFRIFEITKRHGYINVYANQVADDLNGYAINSISVDRALGMTVMSELSSSIKREHPFSFFSDIDERHTFNQSDVSAMEALSNGKHSIMGQWGGELVRDKYQVNLLKKSGKDTETLFMYKKNLKSYEETDTIKGLVSILHLVAEVEEDTPSHDESPNRKTIRVTVESRIKDIHPVIIEKNLKVSDQDVKTEEDLLEYGKKYFEKTLCDIPGNSLKIDVTGNYEGSVKLFDTAIVFHEDYERDLRMQITGYKFGPIANKLKTISFGEVKTNLVKQISNQIDSKVAEAATRHDAAFETKLQKQMDNANRIFEAKERKIQQEIEDGIEVAKAKVEVVKSELTSRLDNQLLPVASEAKGLALKAQAALVQSQAELQGLTRELTDHRRSVLAQIAQAKAQALSQGQKQAALITKVENDVSGLTITLQNLKVGGRNLIAGTDETTIHQSSNEFLRTPYDLAPIFDKQGLMEYTLSFDFKSPKAGSVHVYMQNGSGAKYAFKKHHTIDATTDWQRYHLTVDPKLVREDLAESYLAFYGTYGTGVIPHVRKVKLETGTIPTDYSRAEDDYRTDLATFKQTVHQELATFNRLTETVKGRIDQVESQSEQTAAGFKTSLKALETYTALEPTRASRYFEASKTETARQLTALRTEVSGSYVAKSTYEENARGVTRRFESLSSGGQNYALATEKDVYVTVSSDGLFDLYDFGATLAVKGVSVGDTVALAFNYFTTNKTAFGSYEIELHGHSGKIQRLGEVERTVLDRGTHQVSFVATYANYLGTSLKIRFTGSQLTFRVTKLRLTKGSIAADWSPAPDDIKAYSDQKLTQFRSQFEQTSNEIKANVESLSNQTLKKADVSITSDGIVLKAGKSTGDMARAIGSSFAVTPDAIRIFSNLIKVSGNMLVDGSITSRKLVTGAVETGHIKAGAITGFLLSAEAVSAKHVKVDQALFTKLFANEAYVRQLFAKTAFITQVQAVDISANRVKGGLLAAINGATKFNLNTGALDFYTDSPALRRVLSGYPTQFIRFTTGTSNGKKTGVTIIGSNRNGTESSNDGGFVGVRCWNGNNIDQIDIVGDVVRLASSAFDNSDGWSVKTLPGKLEIDAHRSSDRPSSKLNIGDVNLFRTATNYTSLKDILQQFNINFKHLANITGRGDVISTWETIK